MLGASYPQYKTNGSIGECPCRTSEDLAANHQAEQRIVVRSCRLPTRNTAEKNAYYVERWKVVGTEEDRVNMGRPGSVIAAAHCRRQKLMDSRHNGAHRRL